MSLLNYRVDYNGTPLTAGASDHVVIKSVYLTTISDELAIDLGMAPSPGYWQRREAEFIAQGSLGGRLRILRYRLQRLVVGEPVERVAHAIRALRGVHCERDYRD